MQRAEGDPRKRAIGKTVLVVDDHAMIRKILAAAFLSDVFETCGEAENGRDALDVAQQIKPDLIILDLSMPIMNGLQAAPQLRKLLPGTRMILYTFYKNGGVLEQQAADAGIDLVLSKDQDISILVSKAHELMGSA